MKRGIALLGALCLLSGCGAAATDAAVPMAGQTAMEQTALYGSRPRTPDYVVETRVYEDSACAGDGTELATCRYEVPWLTAQTPEGDPWTEGGRTDEILSAFNERFGQWLGGEEFRNMAAEAEEYYASLEERDEMVAWTAPYMFDLATTTYQTESLLSVNGRYFSYYGGAHGMTALLGWNYDLDRGSFIGPLDVAADQTAFTRAVTEEIIRQIGITSPEEALEAGFWEDYDQTVRDWSSYAVTFDEAGMTVGFSPYELACYAAGPQVFHLSRDFLEPYLSDYGRALLGPDV